MQSSSAQATGVGYWASLLPLTARNGSAFSTLAQSGPPDAGGARLGGNAAPSQALAEDRSHSNPAVAQPDPGTYPTA